jgi:hypothetical protein
VTPILLAVHEQTRELEIIQRELVSRNDADYEIVCEQSVESALERLDELAAGISLRLPSARRWAARDGAIRAGPRGTGELSIRRLRTSQAMNGCMWG